MARMRVSPGWTYHPPRDRDPETYHITTDGTTVYARDTSGQIVGSPSADLGAQVSTSLPAANSVGAEIEVGDGNFPVSTTAKLPKGITAKLRIRGRTATIFALSASGPRLFDIAQTTATPSGSGFTDDATINVASTASFPASGTLSLKRKTVTYTGTTATSFTGCTCASHTAYTSSDPITLNGETFGNFELSDFTVDTAALGTPGSNTHIIFGDLIAGSWAMRVNLGDLSFRRIKGVNGSAPAANSRQWFSIAPNHDASGEATQNTIGKVLFEDVTLEGWGYGFYVGGGCVSVTPGSGANILGDEVKLVRCSHDTLTVPGSSLAAANYQFGGYAQINRVVIIDFAGYNSNDVGGEIDNTQYAIIVASRFVDSFNAKVLSRNFRAPLHVGSQVNTYRDCFFRNKTLDRATGPSKDLYLSGDQSVAGYDYGEARLIDCESLDTITAKPTQVGCNVDTAASTQIKFRQMTISRYRIGYTALSDTTGGNSPVFIDLRSADTAAVYDLDGITFVLAGSITGTGSAQMKMIRLSGAGVRGSYRNIRADLGSLTLGATTSATFYWLAFGDNAPYPYTGTIYIDSVGFPAAVGSGTHHVYYLRTGQVTITGQAIVKGLDTTNLPAGAGSDYNFTDAAHKTATTIKDIISQRAGGGSGPATAPVAMTGLVTATGKAIGSVIAGIPAFVQFVQGSGAAITAIDISTDGGTTYTNLLTQGAGAMPAGADLWVGPFRPDALVKVTFATTQPTTNVIPARQ